MHHASYMFGIDGIKITKYFTHKITLTNFQQLNEEIKPSRSHVAGQPGGIQVEDNMVDLAGSHFCHSVVKGILLGFFLSIITFDRRRNVSKDTFTVRTPTDPRS